MSDELPHPMMAHVAEDMVQAFQIEGIGIRGRVVRLGPLVDDALTKHDYPEPISKLLGEALLLTAMLGSALKFDGRFTLQTQGDGPVDLLVADYEAPGRLRGYAHFDREKFDRLEADGEVSEGGLLGSGHLAMTIDPGGPMDRYQGVVPLDPAGLSQSAHDYFERSEQIATRMRLAVGPLYQRDEAGASGRQWRAGAIMIQHIATAGGITGLREEDDDSPPSDEEENWNRASILLDTVEDHELLDPSLAPERLLYRLFHEDGVRAFERSDLELSCRCSREKIDNVLASFGKEQLVDMVEDGAIKVTCEFCSTTYLFDPEMIGREGKPSDA